MARSLRPRAWDLVKDALARSIANDLAKRDIIGDAKTKVTDVTTAFSSWDNCMKATFCKWPVIAIIIVGSLILLSIVWCIVRCACCGLSCCCGCFQCFKCCGNCCGCCDPPGGRKHKYLDDPYIPPQHGYRTEAPMQAPFASHATPKPAAFGPPQYAEFDMSKKGGEDSLPHMPSWDNAGSRKVRVEEEAVEMSNMKKSPTLDLNNGRMATPSPGPVSPMSPGMTPGGASHRGPYGAVPGSSSGHMSNNSQHSQQGLVPNQQSPGYGQPGAAGPYSNRNQGYFRPQPFDANRQSAGFGLDDEPYDDPTTSMAAVGTQNYPGHGQMNQPYGNGAMGAMGAAGAIGAAGAAAGAMAIHNNVNRSHEQQYGAHGSNMGMQSPASELQDHPYAAPPVMAAAAIGHGGRSSPAANRSAYGQNQSHDQYAEMPVMPSNRDSHHGAVELESPAAAPVPQTSFTSELAGSPAPEGYGVRRTGTGDDRAGGPSQRRPVGMDPRMRNGPGAKPRQHPNQRGESPYGRQQPRGAPGPRNDQGYVKTPYSPPGGNVRAYSPATGPQRPSPQPLSRPAPRSANNSYGQSPPSSPITNNAGFDFTSGFSRPKEFERQPSDTASAPRQSPTRPGYPGYRAYQPGQ